LHSGSKRSRRFFGRLLWTFCSMAQGFRSTPRSGQKQGHIVHPSTSKETGSLWHPTRSVFSSSSQCFSDALLQALLQDFHQVYRSSSTAPKALPWALPEAMPGSEKKRLGNTLFGQRYLTVIFDEGQMARNPGPKHSSALLLLNQANVRLILTATPLQTSTKVCRSIDAAVS
jgi:hypothetical protein